MLKLLVPAAAALALSLAAATAQGKELKSVGVTLGPLGNPFYVALAKGMETEIKKLAPDAKVTIVSHDYDLNKVFRTLFLAGIEEVLAKHTDDAGCHGAWLFGRKDLSRD